ncbi:RluA family pseudouridine synthase [Spirochaetota bacterium]
MGIMTLNILYVDNHILAVEKPAGMLSQGDKSNTGSLLDLAKEYIKETYNKRGNVFLGLVHRLDKPVSGIMIFARTSKAAKRLHSEFKNKTVKKLYVALVKNIDYESDKWVELENEIQIENGFPKIAKKKSPTTKQAKLRYSIISSDSRHSLLLIDLITGRKHQIRMQLSEIGHPITGDKKYGNPENVIENSICLHSYYISIKHPTKDSTIELFSDIPERISKIFTINNTTITGIKRKIKEL